MNKPTLSRQFMIVRCIFVLTMLAAMSTVQLEVLAAPDYNHIIGDWNSNYGPVHVDFVRGERPDGSAMIKGFWLEPPGNKQGRIEVGHYDSRTGELALEYLETWTKHKGKIMLKLDSSGKSFTGTFKNDDGTTGTWTWKRK